MLGDKAVLTASENYGNLIDDPNLECEFAIFFENSLDFENLENFHCQEFDSTKCNKTATPASKNFNPTQAPSTMAPSLRPTRTPDGAPSGAGTNGRNIMILSTGVAVVAMYFAV
jgi:hypothetical protein